MGGGWSKEGSSMRGEVSGGFRASGEEGGETMKFIGGKAVEGVLCPRVKQLRTCASERGGLGLT